MTEVQSAAIAAIETQQAKPGKWKIVDQEHMDDVMSMVDEYLP